MASAPHHASPVISRREMLRRAGMGFGAWALLELLTRDGLLAAPTAARPPHSPAKSKHVIFLFMQGGQVTSTPLTPSRC